MKKIIVAVIAACMIILPACSEIDNSSSGSASKTSVPVKSSSSAAVSSSKEPENSDKSENKIYDDKLITAWFIKKYDVSDVPEMFYFEIKVNNKSNKKITIYPRDSYMNDTTFTAMSGTPMDILPMKNSTHDFFGPYNGTGIKSADKIKKIGFKINIEDENTHDIETTKLIEIKF